MGQKKVWRRIKKLYEKETGLRWSRVDIKHIMSVGINKGKRHKKEQQNEELKRTLISTAVWSI